MDRRQIFDTTVYDEATDTAYGVMSFPFIDGNAPDLLTLLDDLQLRAVAEIDPTKLGDAVSAVLATRHVAETMQWLLDPPDPVALLRPEDVLVEVTKPLDIASLVVERRPRPDAKRISASKLSPPRPDKPTLLMEDDAAAARAFTNAGVPQTLVPLQRSPVDLHPFLDLSDDAYRTLIVTPRSNPLVLVLSPAVLTYCLLRCQPS